MGTDTWMDATRVKRIAQILGIEQDELMVRNGGELWQKVNGEEPKLVGIFIGDILYSYVAVL
jgi:hypothetical protein